MGRPRRNWPGEPKDHNGFMRVWWQGQWFHLGPTNKPEVWKAEHARLLSIWSVNPVAPPRSFSDYTVAGLLADYAESDAKPTHQAAADRIRAATSLLIEKHASTLVEDFGPLHLAAWQKHLCSIPHPTRPNETRFSRTYVCELVDCVRRIWKWGVATERVDVGRLQALMTVARPRRGEAREGRVVQPADPDAVLATVSHLRPPVRALVMLEWATGARPAELFLMKVGEIQKAGRVYVAGVGTVDLDAEDVWLHVPDKHKNKKRGKPRFLLFGPAERSILDPLIAGRRADEYVFRPADAVADLRREQREERESRGGGSGGSRKRPAEVPRSAPRPHYDRNSYHRAVARACKKAGVPHWFPYQLRHLAASEVNHAFGLDGVQAVLGHHTRSMAEHYGGRSFKKAAEIARGRGAK